MPSMLALVAPDANCMRLADGWVAGGGGTAVGGTDVATTAVGGTDVTVTNTAVGGGAEVLVASAAIPVVAVGWVCVSVSTGGGVPLAGSLQAVITTASIVNRIPVMMIFFFIFSSLAP